MRRNSRPGTVPTRNSEDNKGKCESVYGPTSHRRLPTMRIAPIHAKGACEQCRMGANLWGHRRRVLYMRGWTCPLHNRRVPFRVTRDMRHFRLGLAVLGCHPPTLPPEYLVPLCGKVVRRPTSRTPYHVRVWAFDSNGATHREVLHRCSGRRPPQSHKRSPAGERSSHSTNCQPSRWRTIRRPARDCSATSVSNRRRGGTTRSVTQGAMRTKTTPNPPEIGKRFGFRK